MGNYVLSERAARALIPLIRGKAASSSPGYAPAAVSLDAFPATFTVRWSQSENNGDGAWVIWLPDLARLVQLDGAYLTLTGVTAATVLPTGWYTINDDDGEATEVYCNVHRPTGSGSPSANISVDADTATTGESVIPVLVARMVTTSSGAKLVKQFVDSALILAGGGGDQVTPDDVSTEFCPHDDAQGADNTHEGELQIKGWNNGTPRAAYDLAATLKQPNPASPDEKPCVVVRNKDGTLNYMIVGDMSNVMLLDVDQTVSSSKTFTLTQYFGTTSAQRPRLASINGSRYTLTGDSYGDAYVGYYRGKLVLAGCGSGTTTPAANCVILQVSPTLTFGNDEMRTNGQVVLSAGWAHSNTKSLKVNNTEVAKILSSADVNIPLPSSVDISALDGVYILTGLDFGVNTVTGGYGLKFKTRQITVNNGVLALGQEITNIIPTTPISSIVN